MTPISPDELRDALDGDDPVAVLDVREPTAYATGNVPASTLVPRRALERRLPELVPDRDTTVVLVDGAGERTPDDASWLTALGYADATYLEGGVAAWRTAGQAVTEAADGVYASAFNVPSKRFGERVDAERDPPTVTPERLASWRAAGEDPLVVDVRTPGEHREATLPGAVNVEGVDLPAYVEALRAPGQKVVVHCAGRTRSIVATAALKRRGVDEAYGLEDGTAGWRLAGYDLERGAERHVRDVDLDATEAAAAREFAEDLLAEAEAVERLSVEAFADLLAAGGNVYPFDVRTTAEYDAGHVPGTVGVPGGQAVQRADDFVAVREGRIVLVSDGLVRAAVTAYWYAEMGFPDVAVLDGGVDAWTAAGRSLERGCGREERPGLQRAVEQSHGCRDPAGWDRMRAAVETVAPAALADALDAGEATVFDVGRSADCRERRVPGSRWVSRNALEAAVDETGDEAGDVVLSSPTGELAVAAAASLAHGGRDAVVLEGGVDAWTAAGLGVESGDEGLPSSPPDVVPATADQGDEGMRGYLEWEKRLHKR